MERCPICEKDQDGFASIQVDENEDGTPNYGLMCEHCHAVFTQADVDAYYAYLEECEHDKAYGEPREYGTWFES